MRKINIAILSDSSTVELSEKIIQKLKNNSAVEIDNIFNLEERDAAWEKMIEKIKHNGIDFFIGLSSQDRMSDIKKVKPCKHIFTVGFSEMKRPGAEETFEDGFRTLRALRCNMLVVKNSTEEKTKYLIVYPEKTYEIFPDEDTTAENLAKNMIKRENVAHAQSIEEESCVLIPDEVYEKFHRLGEALFEKGLLPVIDGGTYGNFSMMHNRGMYITGRGVNKGNLKRNYIVRINRVEKIELTEDFELGHLPKVFARIYYSGEIKPSTDTAINHAILEETECRATVHVHTDRIFAGLPITAYNYPCGAKEELDEIMNLARNNPNADIIQLYKHGLIAMGSDFDDCLIKIENLFSDGISARKIKESEEKEKEFRQWEEHYGRNAKDKNVDLDIYDASSLYVVQKGETKVGFLYIKPKKDTLYFVFYSLKEFTRKKLGLGEKVIDIVSKMARNEQFNKIGIITTKGCDVIPYYERKGFKITSEDSGGLIWMEKEI